MLSSPGNPKIDELKARLATDPGSRLFFPLAEELRKAGHLDEAERVLRDGIERHPAYLSAWVSLGRVLKQLERHGEAVQALNRALQLDPENVVAARLSAESYLALGDKVEAIKKFKLVHAFLPSDQEIQASIEMLERQLNPEKYVRQIKSTDSPVEFNEVAAGKSGWQAEPQDRFLEEPPEISSPLPPGEGPGVRAAEDPFDGPETEPATTFDQFSFDSNQPEVTYDENAVTPEENAGETSAVAQEVALTPDPSPAGRGEEILSIVPNFDERQRTIEKLHRWLRLTQRSKRPNV